MKKHKKYLLAILIIIIVLFALTRTKIIIHHRIVEMGGGDHLRTVIQRKGIMSITEGLVLNTPLSKNNETNHQVIVDGVAYPSTMDNIEMVKKSNEHKLRKIYR